MNYLSKSIATFAIAGAVAFLAPSAYANSVNINFDSLAVAPGGFVTGDPVTSYLAGYGVSVSNVTPGIPIGVLNVSSIVPLITTSSPPNIFSTMGNWGSYGYETFTLDFSNPVSNFGFTRVGIPYSLSGPRTWTATAYNASSQSLGVVSENLLYNFGESPATQTFALNFQGISHVTFWGTGQWVSPTEVRGAGTPPLDNLTFQTAAVPEPETYAMLLAGLGLLGFTARRRKGVSRQAA